MARYLASSLLAACGLFGLTEQAGAVAIGQMLATSRGPVPAVTAPMLTAARPVLPATCETVSASAQAQSAPTLQPSKASAILGVAVSALERMRLDQAAAEAAATVNLTPGAGPLPARAATPGVACTGFALPRAVVAIAPGRGLPIASGEDFLQTKRLAVAHTAFDRQWARVSQQGLSPQVLARDATLSRFSHGGATMAGVEAVNAWANRRIRFAEDAKLYGTADYWATAQATLKAGAGDCEDIAIAKMQLLAAMGVARSDMYLTIARDLARHADHALLVVRMDGRHWLLDNSTDRVLDASVSYDYQPVLSFSEGRKWLHGATLASR